MNKILINFKGLGLEIKVPVVKVDDLTYNYPIPRPIPKESYLSLGDYTMNASKQEFIDDIRFQIPKSLDGNIEEIAFESLYQIMVKHINKFGRILPVDLDSYIGQNILLFNAIRKAQDKPVLNKEEQEEVFSKFNYMAFGILPDNLKELFRTPNDLAFDDSEIENDIEDTVKPYSTYILRSDKNNGEIRAWIEPGYFSTAEVSVAFNSINKFCDNDLWFEPLEGEDNGSFEIKVEFYKDPFQTKVILNNDGYSQDEIIMIVKSMYDNIPNDRK